MPQTVDDIIAERRSRKSAWLVIFAIIGGLWLLSHVEGSPEQPTPKNQVPLSGQTYEDANAAINRRDFRTALSILRPLAEQGNAKAQTALATMYEAGWGVPQNYTEAMNWHRRAADQKDPYGQMMIATMYRDGHGVPKDYVRAYMWYELASRSDEPAPEPGINTPAQNAQLMRDLLAKFDMTPAQVAEARRLADEWKPGQTTERSSDATSNALPGAVMMPSAAWAGDYYVKRDTFGCRSFDLMLEIRNMLNGHGNPNGPEISKRTGEITLQNQISMGMCHQWKAGDRVLPGKETNDVFRRGGYHGNDYGRTSCWAQPDTDGRCYWLPNNEVEER
jgi:uncharacterized protein